MDDLRVWPCLDDGCGILLRRHDGRNAIGWEQVLRLEEHTPHGVYAIYTILAMHAARTTNIFTPSVNGQVIARERCDRRYRPWGRICIGGTISPRGRPRHLVQSSVHYMLMLTIRSWQISFGKSLKIRQRVSQLSDWKAEQPTRQNISRVCSSCDIFRHRGSFPFCIDGGGSRGSCQSLLIRRLFY